MGQFLQDVLAGLVLAGLGGLFHLRLTELQGLEEHIAQLRGLSMLKGVPQAAWICILQGAAGLIAEFLAELAQGIGTSMRIPSLSMSASTCTKGISTSVKSFHLVGPAAAGISPRVAR
jgi:hypothetical protein